MLFVILQDDDNDKESNGVCGCSRHYTEKRNEVGELCTLVRGRIVPLGPRIFRIGQNFTSAVCAYYYIDTECYIEANLLIYIYRPYKATGLHSHARQRNVNNQFIKTKALMSRREIAPEAIGRGTARVSRRNK